MLVNAHAAYEHGRRFLRAAFCGSGSDWLDYVNLRVNFQPKRNQEPHAVIWWGLTFCFGPKTPPGVVTHLRVIVSPGETTATIQVIDRVGRPCHERPHVIGRAEADWPAFFSLARSVAASRAPKEALAGWLEDCAPEPYNLLAGPDPVEWVRKLVSPLSLWSGVYE